MSTDINLSPFMNLPEPVVGSTDGPQWATNVNTSLTLIDRHNHTPGMGVPITPAGLNINSDLSFNNNSATNVKAVVLNVQPSFASNGGIYVIGTDLYYNNASTGFPVQITNGNSIAGATGSITGLTAPASASYVAPTFVWQSNANTPANLDAGSVILRNVTINSRGLTLSPPTGLSVDYTLVLPTIPAVQSIMALDALGNISAPYTVDGSTIVINTNVIQVGTITNTNIVDNTINGAKIVDHSITDQQLVLGALQVGSAYRNFIINSAFDYWQRATTGAAANGASTYVADRWYIKNSLGGGSTLTMAQVAGVTVGSKYGCSVKITVAPTSSQANGTELYTTLDNLSSRDLMGRNATINAQLKALGNVTEVGIQFYYNTTEAKVSTAIGSEQLVTVNTSTFTLGTLANQLLTAATITANGVVGMRIRVTAVSGGNLYDVNNGFVVEQVQMNLFSAYTAFMRQGSSDTAELQLCQRYYEKSYKPGVYPSATTDGEVWFGPGAAQTPSANNPMLTNVAFKADKFKLPTVQIYDSLGGVGNSVDVLVAGTVTPSVGGVIYLVGSSSFSAGLNSTASVATASAVGFQWTADAEI